MEKKLIIRNIFSYIFIIASISIITLVLYSALKGHKKISQIDIMISDQKKHFEEVTKENRLAKELIEYKKTTISKEREAHERGFYEENEKVVVIKNENTLKNEKDEIPKKEEIKIKKPILAWQKVFFGDR